MALKNYIYQSDGNVTVDDLTPLLAPAASPVIAPITGSPLVTVTVDEVHKEDLDDAMAEFGYFYLTEQTSSIASGRRDYGALASDPLDPLPQIGDFYFNTTFELTKWWNGSSWISYPISTDPLLDFAFNDASPATVIPLVAGAIVEWVKLVISTTFDDPGATLQVGTTAQPGVVLSAVQNDPGDDSVFSTDVPLRVTAPTNLILTISPGTSTQGAGYVLARIRQ